jgi:hypothetical protein
MIIVSLKKRRYERPMKGFLFLQNLQKRGHSLPRMKVALFLCPKSPFTGTAVKVFWGQ